MARVPGRSLASFLALFLFHRAPFLSAQDQDPTKQVTDIDLDDLLKVHVTSPAKKHQPLTDVPAAVTVLRDEDLRRLGPPASPRRSAPSRASTSPATSPPSGSSAPAASTGNEDFQTETLRSAEVGYRWRAAPPLSLDVAGFLNYYDRIRTGSIGTPFLTTDPAPLHAVIPVNLGNDQHGQTRGVEAAINLQAAS